MHGRSFDSNVPMDFTSSRTPSLPSRRGAASPSGQGLLDDQALIEGAGVMLDRVGLGYQATTPVADLAHGERRLLELALALAAEPARCFSTSRWLVPVRRKQSI